VRADPVPSPPDYQAVFLIAFGGPTAMDEVRPFLAEVLRGRPVPPARIEEVVHHYEIIGGRSPLNELTFRQAAALRALLARDGPALPVYVGMRNWHPFVRDTLADMHRAGVRRALGFIMSAQQSEAGWERYQASVATARAALGTAAPDIAYTAGWHAHPLFIEAVAARIGEALAEVPAERRGEMRAVFTAHSIPVAAAASGPYVAQLEEGMQAAAARSGVRRYRLAYQSRSGSPGEPWLEPDICDVVREEAAAGARDLLVVPIGFVCDHVEVLYDLDVEARRVADEAGVGFYRARTVNDHPAFIRMMADVIRSHVARR
jgi:ferrochelatase